MLTQEVSLLEVSLWAENEYGIWLGHFYSIYMWWHGVTCVH